MNYYDNTRISSFRSCPRFFYFRHVRHWKPEGIGLALIFGLSWHESMDVIWGLTGKNEDREVVGMAHEAFKNKFAEEYGRHPDDLEITEKEQMEPRNPDNALEMLANYQQQRKSILENITLLHVERPFAVPLSEDRDDLLYVGRRDKDFEYKGEVITGEHKTTTAYKKGDGFREQYLQSFSPDSQVDGYLHSGHMDYGDKFRAVWVDAALVHKHEHGFFKFIPVRRATEMLDQWLADTMNWVDAIEYNLDKEAADRKTGAEVMHAFPKNTGSCWDFNRECPFISICRYNPNPHMITEAPDGFVEEPWSPFDTLELEKIGLEPEGGE